MRKFVVFAALAGTTFSVVGMGLRQPEPAFGTELDGFAINTQDKAVTVTLFTDQRINYTTETQGRQYAIVLPNTQISKSQMDNGLPVVIDNKNRFIGRAVPTEDGKVKIILPNLPANEFSVSVQQKRPGQTAASLPVATAKPHAAIAPRTESQFEKVAESFAKPRVAPRPAIQQISSSNMAASNATSTPAIRLSSAPKVVNTGHAGTVWNPYVIKAPSVPKVASSPYSNYRPVIRQKSRPAPAPQPEPADEPIKFTSLMDSQNQASENPAPPAFPPQIAAAVPPPISVSAEPANDPLWFLHSLQPNVNNVPADDLKGLAQEDPFIPTRLFAKAEPQKPAVEATATNRSALGELKDSILNLPHWLLLTLALFLGGMGLFSLIGGLVLLKMLFGQSKPNLQPTFILSPGMQFVPADASGQPLAIGQPMTLGENGQPAMPEVGKSAYASRPEVPQTASRPELPKPAFKDTASVNAMDYLKDSSQDITRAVQNSVLVKFPSRTRQRNASPTRRPAADRPTGTDSIVGLRQ